MLNIEPKLPKGKNWARVASSSHTIYVSALLLNWLLGHDSIDEAAHVGWKTKLENVIDVLERRFPGLMRYTGFPEDWKKNPLWWQV